MLKRGYIIILFLCAISLIALSLQEIQIASSTTTISAGGTATITLPVQTMNADSLAYQLEVDKTNVSASITYEYITPSGKTKNEALSSLPVGLVLDSSESAGFGTLLPSIPGATRIRGYLYITNKGSLSQAVLYSVSIIKKQR